MFRLTPDWRGPMMPCRALASRSLSIHASIAGSASPCLPMTMAPTTGPAATRVRL